MVAPTPHIFDEAQLQIYTLMHRDSYPRFVNSAMYKEQAQLTNGNQQSGMAMGVVAVGKDSSAWALSDLDTRLFSDFFKFWISNDIIKYIQP